jgi:uncharacterized protein YhhL (DUF1145 family)
VSAQPESVSLFISVVNCFVALFHIVQLFIVSSTFLTLPGASHTGRSAGGGM